MHQVSDQRVSDAHNAVGVAACLDARAHACLYMGARVSWYSSVFVTELPTVRICGCVRTVNRADARGRASTHWLRARSRVRRAMHARTHVCVASAFRRACTCGFLTVVCIGLRRDGSVLAAVARSRIRMRECWDKGAQAKVWIVVRACGRASTSVRISSVRVGARSLARVVCVYERACACERAWPLTLASD
eukprot:6210482-Pleurochrysis_carterae.AAC.2